MTQPTWIRGLALVTVAFLTLPLIGLLIRVPWPRLPELLLSPAALDALGLSLRTCVASALLALVFGVPLALVLARSDGRVAATVRTITSLPLVLPPVVAGLALLVTLGRRGVLGQSLSLLGIEVGFSTLAVVIAQVFVSMPYLVVAVEGAIRSAASGYEVVAATLGASPTRTLFWVTLPSLAPALASGLALAFARSLGEFGATLSFAGSLQGTTRTMPIEIYLQREIEPDSALALAAVLLLVAVVGLALTSRLGLRKVADG